MDFRSIGMGVLFSLMWSSAFATARVIVAHAPPLYALTLRFLLSGLIAIALARIMGQSWRLSPAQWRVVVVFGICQNALYLGLNFTALQWVEASIASIIASSMPLIVAALGWALGREKVPPFGQLGLGLGFVGVALVMGTRVSGGADPLGIVLCVMGATGLAVATLTVRSVSAGGNLLMVVGLQMWVGSAALGVTAVLTEPLQVTPSLPLLAAFLYQIFIPGLAATILWFALVKRVGAVRASTFHFMNPFFGVTISAMLLGEAISTTDIAGVLIAMAGILAVQMSRLKQPAAPES